VSAGVDDIEFPFLAPPAEAVAPLERPPTFSIVITAYQAAETIAAAVASALEQTHPAEEVVVVDDGSTDDLAGALAPFRDRIEVVSKPNGGGASARNAGAAAASAEFMAVLDADDRYHPRRLEAIAAVASGRPDLDLITTDAQLIVDGEPRGRFSSDTPFAARDQREEILRSCFVGGWPAVRIARLDEIGGFDEEMRIAYDWDCWLRLILSGSAAGFVDEPFYDYVLHQGSLAASRVPSLWERVRLLEKVEAEPGLTAGERDLLRKILGWRRSEAVREEAYAIATGNGERSRSLSLARLPGIDGRARVAAALAGWAPSVTRRLTGGRRAPADRL
jgi:glycosyltransferase involved in cell wall biosynthesis